MITGADKAEIAQRLQREIRRHTTARFERVLSGLEGPPCGRSKGRCRSAWCPADRIAFLDRSYAVAPVSIMRERLGASRLRSQTRRWRGLDPPGALPAVGNYWSDGGSSRPASANTPTQPSGDLRPVVSLTSPRVQPCAIASAFTSFDQAASNFAVLVASLSQNSSNSM